MRRGGWVVGVATVTVMAMVLAACGGDETAGNGSGYAAPADDFCGDLIDAVIPRPGPGVLDSWVAGGDVRRDGSATTATCTFTGGDHQIAVVVMEGDDAEARYDEAVDELESGAVGFEDPEVSPIEGWWSRGQRFEPARPPVRVADVMADEDVFARVEVVEYGGRRGQVAPRREEAVELAESVTAAMPEVLGRE